RTLTAGVTSDRDGAEIRMTVSGIDEVLDFRQSRVVHAPVRVTDDRGRVMEERSQRYHVNSHLYRLMEGPTRFQRMVALDRIEPDARAIEIVMTGGGGDWRFTIPIEAQSASGARAMRTDAIDVHHGIAIEAPLVARSERITAIELQAYFLDHADAADGSKRT